MKRHNTSLTAFVAAFVTILSLLGTPYPSFADDDTDTALAKRLLDELSKNPDLQKQLLTIVEGSRIEAMNKISGSVVSINVSLVSQEHGLVDKQHQISGGSGAIISKDGYVITNLHVVRSGQIALTTIKEIRDTFLYKVKLSNGDQYDGELFSIHQGNIDLAIVKMVDPPDDLQVAKFGNSDDVRAGETACAVGAPFGFRNSFSCGIISHPNRVMKSDSEKLDDIIYIQTDASINPGNSGGPLVNKYGEVIGISTMIYSNTGQFAGIGFAIPGNLVNRWVKAILSSGATLDGWIGLEVIDKDIGLGNSGFKPPNAYGGHSITSWLHVFKVEAGSPADQSGLRNMDVIFLLNGKTVSTKGDFYQTIVNTPADTTILLTIFRLIDYGDRNGVMEIKVTISHTPKA